MPSYRNLSNARQWKSTIGINEKQFWFLKSKFQIAYETYFLNTLSEKEINLKQKFIFSTYEDIIFFLLFFLKNPVIFDTLGFIFGMTGSNAQRIISKLMPVLEKTLSDNKLIPVRNFKDIEQFKDYMQSDKEIIIDATEMSIERPVDYNKQKELYSGKKKRHTVKSLIITNATKFILYMGNIVFGKTHDFKMLQDEFDPVTPWFLTHKVRIDLGFQGFEKLYKTMETFIPFKKKRVKKGEKSELTPEQKEQNKQYGKERIFVEHSIGGAKRYRILIDRLRYKSLSFINSVVGICAGLWNFTLIYK